MFSDYPDEKEVLLEPERKLKIKSVAREGNIIAVNADIVKTPLVLEDLIKVKAVKIKERKSKIKEVPENFRAVVIPANAVKLLWSPVDVKSKRGEEKVSYKISVKKIGGNLFRRNIAKIIETMETKSVVAELETNEEYEFQVCCGYGGGWGSWSSKVVVRACAFLWKECPDDVYRKYSVDMKNPRIATNIGGHYYCTIIGNTSLPPNKVTSWSIKILKSKKNDGYRIYIGVAPSGIDQNERCNYDKCGWYFYCYWSTLYSGPPHNYNMKDYGPRKDIGKYVHTGDSVGVVMDTAKGELSFALNGVNLGVAYKGIPLDKPLVPCVLLKYKDDSVELVI